MPRLSLHQRTAPEVAMYRSDIFPQNPVAFSQDFEEQHGLALTVALQRLAPLTVIVNDDLYREAEDLREAYPCYQEDARLGDYRRAMRALRRRVLAVPDAERERLLELTTFAVHLEMKHYIDPRYGESLSESSWSNLAVFDLHRANHEEWVAAATEKNGAAWRDLGNRAFNTLGSVGASA
jgi:hypothetical protein